MGGDAGGWVEEGEGAGYPGAPVAALGDCFLGDMVNGCTVDGFVDDWKEGEGKAWEKGMARSFVAFSLY